MRNSHCCSRVTRSIALFVWALVGTACSSNSENTGTAPGLASSGGASAGGQSGTLTSSSPSGGAATGGNGTGGAATGGSITGGTHTAGGSVTGGFATGGSVTGGVGTGGTRSTGGAAAMGGSATGGAVTGGAATGGSVTGGAYTAGGSAAGTGGAHTGGAAATGGNATGGASSTGGATAFNPCPASGTCAIMPLGDSITDGVGSSQGGGYRVQLFHDAVQGHQSITFVGSASDPNGPTTVDGKPFPRNHEGHPGYTVDNSSTTSGISPLVDASIATNHPNIILLMIGTNDLNRNIDPTNFPTRLGALMDKIINDAPNSLVVVAKITPWQDDGTNVNAVEPFNTKIATVVQTRITSGKHVALVDMYTPFRANSNYKTALMNDYLHPNNAGYVIMGDVWYSAIKGYLPAAP
jgi:lysophospholipase L1-like esterase